MPTTLRKVTRDRRRNDNWGKSKPVSFAKHQLIWMDRWDVLAESECMDASAYVKHLLMREWKTYKQQQLTDWEEIFENECKI